MIIQDILYASGWWLLFFVVGIGGIPLMYLLFRNFVDVGYGFSKTFGFIIVSYVVFFFSTLKIIPLYTIFLYFFLIVYFFVNRYIFSKKRDEILSLLNKNKRFLIIQEILFTLGYFLWVYVRTHQPDINGLEKFMDFGFINSTLRSKFLPPPDMWLAGSTINYYWYGHYFVAFLTKLSQIPSQVTYNLMLATIMGLTLTGTFSLTSTLISKISDNIDKRKIIIAGFISAIAVTFAGNFHTPFYLLKDGRNKYWYPDATRFIGYNPDTQDKTIHEFPIYSFVVSDLHAHLIGLPFIFVFLALLWNALEKKGEGKKYLYKFIPPGFLLGVMFMTNAWDFANYSLISGFIILFASLKKWGLKFEAILLTALAATVLVITGVITTLPFLLIFDSIAQGVAFVNAHSPVWQLAILWGFPAVFTIIFVYKLLLNKSEIKLPDAFVLGLIISAWALIIIPEIIYVKDIYIASHHRANTMFKLTYQAFVISYIASGYITIRTFLLTKGLVRKLFFSLFFAVIFASVLYYPKLGIDSYYGELKVYHGLAGDTWLKERYPATYEAVSWLKDNVKGQTVILEAPGDSYTDYNVISSYTGLPTVSGWFVHEWLWRGTSDVPSARVSDIDVIYTSNDLEKTTQLLNHYKVEYVVVGSFEREKFANLVESKFNNLGSSVFSWGDTTIYKIKSRSDLQ